MDCIRSHDEHLSKKKIKGTTIKIMTKSAPLTKERTGWAAATPACDDDCAAGCGLIGYCKGGDAVPAIE